ncbi:unnamed protein product [Rotaria magnacalcarata]|uniref:EF-hand domain-containing protein n=2 Tax=Rotaria magnacalcarata TaxID=392030 RepID=A0A8S2QNJ1_9BILA|nr:unnamed protein product [Rotaria magnacalcarata]
MVRGSIKEKLNWIFRFYDVYDEGKLTKQAFETILRSLYELLGSNTCVHQPVTDETIQKHLTILFDKLDFQQSGSINIDDFIKYCLRNETLVNEIQLLSSSAI